MLILTVPHAGEKIPSEAIWLKSVSEATLLTDVDRFVDKLYAPVCARLALPFVVMEIHRYVLDLNRFPTDIDGSSVEGAGPPAEAKFASGFHWTRTTRGDPLIEKPISRALHDELVRKYYDPFHAWVAGAETELLAKTGGLPRYYLDCHSMPSRGTGAHRDSGETRPDIVVSDCEGKSCSTAYKDLCIKAYSAEGFRVAYNWPYKGGRMTERYGRPGEGRHSVQIELNRSIYMDEATRAPLPSFDECSTRLGRAVEAISKKCRSLG